MAANDTVIGNLRVVLGLDSAQFESGMKRQAANANAAGASIGKGVKAGLKDVEATFGRASSQAGAFGAALTAMGVTGAAAGAALVGTFTAVRNALSFGDEIGDTAAKLAVSTDALQEYRFAVHALGGDYADADAALEGFSKAFGAAHAQLSKRAAKPFEALGLDAKSFDSTEDALQAVIEKIGSLKSSAEQAAIADKLGLTPMLTAIRAGVSELDRLRAKAHELGYVMDEDLVSRAGEANDKFEDLQQVIGVQLHSAFVDLAPELLSLMGLATDLATKFREAADAFRDVKDKTGQGLRDRKVELERNVTALGLRELGGQKLSASEQAALGRWRAQLAAVNAEIQTRAANSSAPAPNADGTSLNPVGITDKSAQVRSASDAAIARAAQAELAARLGLVGDIKEIAELKSKQVDQETRDANQRLLDDAEAGKITDAAAKIAIGLNNRAATEQKALIEREKEADLAAQSAEQEAELGRYRQQIASVQAQLATSAEARANIELKALADQQKIDRDTLQASLDKRVAAGEITEAYRQQLLAGQKAAQDAETEKAQRDKRIAVNREAAESEQAQLQLQLDIAQAQGQLADTVTQRRQAELRLLKLQKAAERKQLEQITVENGYSEEEARRAKDRLAHLDQIYGLEEEAIRRQNSLNDAFREASDSVSYMAEAFRRGDWVNLFEELQRAIGNVVDVLGSDTATLGEKISVVGGVVDGVGRAIGGKAGKALSWAAQGAMIGAQFGGPIGAAIGGLVGGVGSLLGGKKSNNAAIAQINGDLFSIAGDKRNSGTNSAAQSAAQAVIQAQDLLRQAGVTLTQTVKAIDIGERDKTAITLSDGTYFRTAAVGDAAEAADTALKRVLASATFVDQAQERLVKSMLAAGNGFDQIAASLQAYSDAQALPQELADAILQYTDAKAYDVQQLQREQKARRDSVKAAVDQGYITADAFATVSGQLDKLEQLELDEVLARYADATDDLAERQQAAADAVDKARGDLQAAYDAQVTTLQGTIDKFSSLSTNLRKFDETLRDQMRSPAASLAMARAAFAGVAGRTDPDSLAKLQGVGEAYVDAARTGARSQIELVRAQAQVRAAALAGAAAADAQVSIAQQQLDALNAQVSGLLEVNDSVLTVAQAIGELTSALIGQARVNTTTPATANDNIDVAKYLADNPDLQANWDAGGIMRTLGVDLTSAARQHYLQQGQYEIAAGLRKFATGGSFKVGGLGGVDSQLVKFMASPDEYVHVTRGDSMRAMADELRALRGVLTDQGRDLAKTARASEAQHILLRRLSRDGDSLVTTAA